MKNAQWKDLIEKVTPDKAKEMLTKANEKNRRINMTRVHAHAEVMRRGLWVAGPDFGISFDSKGMLLNGHHRLTAVIVSGKTIPFVIYRNVPSDNLEYIDTAQSRTNKQVMHMFGVNTTWDSALRAIYTFTHGTNYVSPLTLKDLRQEWAKETTACAPALALKVASHRIPAGALAGLVLAARKYGQTKIGEFIFEFDLIAKRESVGAPAIHNVVRWMEKRKGTRAGALALKDYCSVMLNGIEQWIGNETKKAVHTRGDISRYLNLANGEARA